ncbi:UNVERIFIED_CONTAM: hypothetical protein RMT77_001924 [Armadillidium vulgare]
MEKSIHLNAIEGNKLHALLMRFYHAIYSESYLFSKEEKEKLEKSLQLSAKEFNEILTVIKDILFESAQNTLHPQILKTKLVSFGMLESHAEIFSDLWAQNGKMVIGKLKKISLSQWQLKGLSWEFHAETSSTSTARQKCPIVIMDLNLFEAPPLLCNTSSDYDLKGKNVVFQMDGEDLLQFYNELEKIQQQIDSLNS